MKVKIYHSRVLIAWLAGAVLAVGLMTLVGTKPAWTASRSFEPAPNSPFSVGSTPTTVTSADFNSDGKMDLAAQNAGSNNVSVRLGNGDGTFQAKPDVTVGSSPTSVISADLNDDGKLDLAVSNQGSDSVTVRLGNGDGTFPARQDFPTGFDPTSVISADFNGDRYADLAVADLTDSSVSILLGQDSNGDGKADGTFQPKTNYPVFRKTCNDFICEINTGGPNQVMTADFNGDNRADLATANIGGCDLVFPCGPGGVSVLLGNGNGTFQTASLATGGTPITSIDANGVGDIMATKYNDNIVSVLRSNGNGTFFTGPQLPAGTNPSAVTSVDLDGDAREDLAVSNFGSDNVSVLFNNGSSSFQPAQNFPAGDGPAFVIGARLNADTFPDLAVANQGSNNVSVLLNSAPRPETNMISGPSEGQVVNSTSATFGFTSSEPGSTFQCSLDDPNDAAFSPCTSPKTVPSEGQLADGTHTFYVRATGTAGTDLTPARRTWRVDTTAPDTNIATKPDDPSNNASPSLSFSSNEANSTFECKLDGGVFTACTSPKSLSNLTDGSHTFSVRARDEAGNVDGSPASYSWTVDITAPASPVISSPANNSFDTDGTITISGTAEANSTVQVFEATASGDTSKGTTPVDASGTWTKTLSGVSNGSHTYKAKAKDAADNTSGFSNTRTVIVDTVKPIVSSTTPLAGSTNVGLGTNLTATFSEKMMASSIIITPATTFKLYRIKSDGTQTQITDVVVSLSSDGLKATLNPFGAKTTLLVRNTKYKGVVTTGAKDVAGNAMAQQKSWTFKTKS